MRTLALTLLALLLVACSPDSNGDAPDVGPDTPTTPTDTQPDTPDPGDGIEQDLGAEAVGPTPDTPVAELPEEDVGQVFPCEAIAPVLPRANFFTDVSDAAGIRAGNYIEDPATKVPINDHSRLAFADLNADGWDDIVMHSLFPNPQAGIPFEHLVFLNDGDGTFTDFSDASGLRDVQAGFFAFADVDNDGDQDCFAGLDIDLPGANHAFLINDGSGHFTVKADAGIATSGMPKAVGNAVFADFDGDGDLDLFVGLGQTSYVADDWFFLGNGDGTFTAASSRLGPTAPHPTNGSTTCDFDDDGDLDIVVSTYSVSTNKGLNVLWRNDGNAQFSDVAVAAGFASLPTGNYHLSSTGYGLTEEPGAGAGSWVGSNGFGVDCDDLDNDGLMDIFLTTISHPVDGDYNRKWSDPTQVLYNQGSHQAYAFENRFLEKGLPFNEGDVDGAALDFDNDGRMDLSISRDNKYEGAYEALEQKSWFGLMHQLPDGSFESLGPESGINDLEVAYAASLLECTDDGPCPEGEACLFTRCRNPCAVTADCPEPTEYCAWGWNGTLGAHQGYCRPHYKMKKAQNHAWADVDHDGDLDLLVGGRDIGGGRPNFLFRNDIGQDNRWLAVRVVGDGAVVNRDGIGTRITVTAGDVKIVGEVKSSRGMYNSEDTRIQHLGLGMLDCEYTVEVRWPDGTTAAFPAGSFPEQTHLTLTYPDTLEW